MTGSHDTWSVRVATGTEVAAAQALEHDIFVAEGFCARSDRSVVDEYQHLDGQSRWYVASNADRIVGVLRVMESGPEPVPALSAFDVAFEERLLLKGERFQEVGTLAIEAAYRGTDLALHLYRAAIRGSMEAGTSVWLAVAEEWLVQYLRDLGFPFRSIGPVRSYMGGDCFPAAVSFREAHVSVRAKDEEFYEWLTGGLQEPGST